MRIALNHTKFGFGGGVEGYLRRLVEHLATRGHEVHFFGRRATLDGATPFAVHRVRCLPVPQSLRILTFAYRSARLLRTGGFDISYGFGRTIGHDLHRDSNGTFEALRRATAPMVKRSRLYAWVASHLERVLYTSRDLRHTVAVSQFVKRQIAERYAIPETRLSVNYNGIDAARFSPENRAGAGAALRGRLGVAPGRLVALFVGNDWRRKGLATAIEGIGRAAAPWELWVVGVERASAEFHRAVDEAGLGSRVRFVGHGETRDFYAAADAFIFPSRFDPLANVVLEAMASGLPAIVSPTDGAAELITSGESGFVLGRSDAAADAAAVLDRLVDPGLRRAVGERARATVLPLTWARHFAQLDQTIEGIAREKEREGMYSGNPWPRSRRL